MCSECNIAFFLSPLKSGIVLLSFAISIIAFVMLKRAKSLETRKRLLLLYVHVFAFVFPFLFYMAFRGCQSYFSGCSQLKAILSLVGLTGIISGLIALGVAPIVFARRYAGRAVSINGGKWKAFLAGQSERLGVRQPSLHVLNTAKPVAFSFFFVKPRIFLSVGLFDILGRREIEAILLHELAHIKNRVSLLKLSTHIARFLSPFAMLAAFTGNCGEEEAHADSYAILAQGNCKSLNSAKLKISEYFKKDD